MSVQCFSVPEAQHTCRLTAPCSFTACMQQGVLMRPHVGLDNQSLSNSIRQPCTLEQRPRPSTFISWGWQASPEMFAAAAAGLSFSCTHLRMGRSASSCPEQVRSNFQCPVAVHNRSGTKDTAPNGMPKLICMYEQQQPAMLCYGVLEKMQIRPITQVANS